MEQITDTYRPPDEELTVDEVATEIRVNKKTLYRWLKRGEIDLEFIRYGKRVIRVRRSALNAYKQRNTQNQ